MNSNVLMTIKESKKKSISQITAICTVEQSVAITQRT